MRPRCTPLRLHSLLMHAARMLVAIGLLFTLPPLAADALAQPVTSDSRIKTFVYNPNEVFTITTHYGYQSNIEFGVKESIETVSVGDRVAWQIIPAGRRLFIRAMEENARTNMTIVTNLRSYQFDLRSSSASAVFGSEALTYVVRFYYPTEAASMASAPVAQPPVIAATPAAAPPTPTAVVARDLPPAPSAAPAISAQKPVAPVTPVQPPVVAASRPTEVAAPKPVAPAATPIASHTAPSGMNYRYTLSGPDEIAPTKIYDDGKTTYFKLPSSVSPKFAILTAAGSAIDVPARRTPDGLVAVDAVAQSFRLRHVGKEVVVYNEAGGAIN